MGTAGDYRRMWAAWLNLPLPLTKATNKHYKWYGKVADHLNDLFLAVRDGGQTDRAKTFFQNIFVTERCGSGHQVEVSGWYADLYRKLPRLRYACNFSSHVSRVDYKQAETGRCYSMVNGILSSFLDEAGIAWPTFGSVVYGEGGEAQSEEIKPADVLRVISEGVESKVTKLRGDWKPDLS